MQPRLSAPPTAPGRAVDRQAVAADPARRQFGVLVAAEGQGAAAVVGAFVEADPVGDAVAAGRRFRPRAADRDREAVDHLVAVAQFELAPGERGVQRVAGPVDVDLGRVAGDPAELAVRQFRRGHPEPAGLRRDHREGDGRAEFGLRRRAWRRPGRRVRERSSTFCPFADVGDREGDAVGRPGGEGRRGRVGRGSGAASPAAVRRRLRPSGARSAAPSPRPRRAPASPCRRSPSWPPGTRTITVVCGRRLAAAFVEHAEEEGEAGDHRHRRGEGAERREQSILHFAVHGGAQS